MSSSERNRAIWNLWSDAYQSAHGLELTQEALAWGVWRVPESELKILDPVQDRRVLELGCGAAQWTLGLIAAGARAIGVDLSEQQLTHARAAAQPIGGAAFVQGDAESLPFPDGVFDIVFCDHGATVFAAPWKTVAEASRVLRPGGLFAFCMSTPIRDICYDPATDTVSSQLVADYFGLSTFEDGGAIEYQLPYGAWIRLFRSEGFVVEDLVELQPPPHAVTTYSGFVPMG